MNNARKTMKMKTILNQYYIIRYYCMKIGFECENDGKMCGQTLIKYI